MMRSFPDLPEDKLRAIEAPAPIWESRRPLNPRLVDLGVAMIEGFLAD